MNSAFDFDALPPLREVIAGNGLRAEKKLGQNFLLDLNITDKIVRAAGDLSAVTVFEIGPGPGGLTRSLLKAGAQKVIAIEYDRRAVAALEDLAAAAGGRLQVIHGDALETNLPALAPEGNRIVAANLPYNIAARLLTGWLRQLREEPGCFGALFLMFQREVAERLIAKPGTKTYGRLSVITQWLCDAQILFSLPPQAFTPPPKVSSSVVKLIPKELRSDAPAFSAVEKVTAAAFGQRRKMVRTSLKDYVSGFKDCAIDPKDRAENLAPDAYIALARQGILLT